jgi:hypothetical protein
MNNTYNINGRIYVKKAENVKSIQVAKYKTHAKRLVLMHALPSFGSAGHGIFDVL